MEYVWDEGKNASNIAKHGMDFSNAYRVFEQAMLIAQDDREDYGEVRYIGFGRLDERVVIVVYTEPDENTTRIISLRRATAQERKSYERNYRYQADRNRRA